MRGSVTTIGISNATQGDLSSPPTLGQLEIGAGITLAQFAGAVINNSTTAPNFTNLTMTLYADAARTRTLGSLLLTGPDGLQLNMNNGLTTGIFDLSSVAGAFLYLSFTGQAFESLPTNGGRPDVNVQVTPAEVPIPGAMMLLMSGIAGLAFAARSKQRA